MYFDAVVDEKYRPIFNGSPDQTKEWLKSRQDDETLENHSVLPGKTLKPISIEEYLKS